MADAPAEPVAVGDGDVIEVDLDWRVAVLAAVTLMGLTLVVALIRSAPRSFTWLAIAGLLALALDPLVDVVQQRVHTRRGVAVGVVAFAFLVAVALLALLLGPPAVAQARDFSEELPEVVASLSDVPLIGDDLERNHVPAKVERWISDLPSRLSGDTAPIEGAARSIAGGLLAGLATVVLTVALLLDGDRLLRAVHSVVPARRQDEAARIGRVLYRVVGKYFAGSLLVAGLAGVVTLIVGLVLGVPLAPLLAVNVAVFDLVPQIGGAVGGIPFVALAFTVSPTTGVIAAIFFILYLQFENHLLQPLVVGEAVDLSPPATMVAALVGVSVAGVPGALIGVPVLGALKASYNELRRNPPDEDSEDEPELTSVTVKER